MTDKVIKHDWHALREGARATIKASDIQGAILTVEFDLASNHHISVALDLDVLMPKTFMQTKTPANSFVSRVGVVYITKAIDLCARDFEGILYGDWVSDERICDVLSYAIQEATIRVLMVKAPWLSKGAIFDAIVVKVTNSN